MFRLICEIMQHFGASIARLAATRVTAVAVTVTDVNLSIRDKTETCSMKAASQQYQRTLKESLQMFHHFTLALQEKPSQSLDFTVLFGLRPDNSVNVSIQT